ncbi:MAG: thiol:disulfide interchange protein [Maricaulis sp.]|nr:thiol:disulfide interchange protein [Oceanicaulis sp.]MAZ92235.1 thiol:disulfide interchange protein [Maricaulis sp.]
MRFVLFALILLGLNAPADAQPAWASGEPIVEARLVSELSQAEPGRTFHIGLHQVMPEGWHTYWRNPGDNGLPVEIDWTAPAGVSIGGIVWPAPIELPLTDEIMDYGYKGEVTLPMPVTIDPGFAGDSVTLIADATWLVCEDICIPEERTLELTVPVGEAAERDEAGYWTIRAALDAEPMLADDLDAQMGLTSGHVVLDLGGGDLVRDAVEWRNLRFFPYEAGLIRHAGPQEVQRDGERVLLVMEPGYAADDKLQSARGGVLSYEVNAGGRWQRHAVAVSPEPASRTPAVAVANTGGADAGSLPPSLPWLFVLAFGGGLILNLMPCVFPILSIKVLKFVQVAHSDAGQVRQQGLFFLAGVLASFVGLAALLVGLREFGLPVGWGFQLQVPVVVAALALLLFAIGLNLLGAFEFGTRLMGLGSGLTEKPGWRGAFFTGVLAVVVAAPCVGPLAAGALGLALTQPTPVVLAVAAALGLGLAAPFVLFSFFPAMLRVLPRPGEWMVVFRQALAFPMFASVIWLLWVLSIQSGPTGVLLAGIAMVALGLAVWANRGNGAVWKSVAFVALAVSVASTVWVARIPEAAAQQTASGSERFEPWSQARVEELRAEGRAVFVDVTAAWCVTCQVNKLRVLHTEDIQAAFDRFDVAQLRADWTNRDETIAALIAEHGQAGVPLYLLYPAGGGPAQVLPTVLTKSGLEQALDRASRRNG